VRRTVATFAALAVVGLASVSPAAATLGRADDTPTFDPASFVGTVDNPYFPLVPGARWVYEGKTKDGTERTVVEVTNDTKQILGIDAVVVHDTVSLDGEVIEDTFDWYAQDQGVRGRPGSTARSPGSSWRRSRASVTSIARST
jgi:hypothetical protein